MIYYDAKPIADSLRTVRKNTITLAEEIPADHIVPHLTRQREAMQAQAQGRA